MSQVSPAFPTPFWVESYGDPNVDGGPAPKCLDEWFLYDLSAEIRRKPDWQIKSQDPEIVEKWKKEIERQYSSKTLPLDTLIDYVFKELNWYKNLENDPKMKDFGFKIASHDSITFSNSAIDETLQKALQTQSLELKKSFGSEIDYHPGSNNQVIDLVHPSLYPVVYGKTKQYDPTTNELSIIEYSKDIIGDPNGKLEDVYVSKKFQWLPTIFTNNKSKFSIDSYINNLNPIKFQPLYTTIEEVFNKAIPGINHVLSRIQSPEYTRIKVPSNEDIYTKEFNNQIERYYDSEDYREARRYRENNAASSMRIPKPVYENDPITRKVELTEYEKLKVIVKMADIELTPENPKYPGGSWHVEGTYNEDIVATVLYYYEVDNITESKLSFRQAFDDPNYVQDDGDFCKNVFGLEDGDTCSRNIGSVKIEENQLLVFPNIFQHHVEPFELMDKTKNGNRKILCYFLVDPYNKRNLSSKEVLPQKIDWYKDETIIEYLKIPREFVNELKNGIDFIEALEIRDELMKERSRICDVSEEIFTREFSLCEH